MRICVKTAMTDDAALELLLRTCARRETADAVALRLQRVVDATPASSFELFSAAAQEWTDESNGRVSSDTFLLLVIACKWEAHLAHFLLQHHARDAADSMCAMLDACERLAASGTALCTLPVLDALLATTVAFSIALSTGAQTDSTTLLAPLLQDGSLCCSECLHTRLPLLGLVCAHSAKSTHSSHDGASWSQFLHQLPTTLDVNKFDSKISQELCSAIAPLIAQHQRMLAALHLQDNECDGRSSDGGDVEHVHALMKKLQEATARALCGRSDSAAGPRSGVCACSLGHGGSVDQGQTSNSADDVLDVIQDQSALERYLLSKRSHTVADSQNDDSLQYPSRLLSSNARDEALDRDDPFAAFTNLLEALMSSSPPPSPDHVASVLQEVRDELTQTTDLNALGVHVSFLLSAQQQRKCNIEDTDAALAEQLNRQVLRAFNSLTHEAASVRALLLVAAFSPSAVLQELLQRSMVASEHVYTYAQVLELCPVLLNWTTGAPVPSRALIFALQSQLESLVADHRAFEAQSRHLLELLCALAGVAPHDSTIKSEERDGVVSVDKLLQGAILPACRSVFEQNDHESSTCQVAIDLCSFVRSFFQRAASSRRWRTASSGLGLLKDLVALFMRAYRRQVRGLQQQRLELSNALLLAIKDVIVRLGPRQLQSALLDAQAFDCSSETLDEKLLMLLAHCGSSVADEDRKPAVQDALSRLRVFAQLLATEDAPECSRPSADDAQRNVCLLLWKLLWSAVLHDADTLEHESWLSDEQVWVVVDRVACSTFTRTAAPCVAGNDSASMPISGRALIETELDRLLGFCHMELVASLVDRVLPALVMRIEPTRPARALQLSQLPFPDHERSDFTVDQDVGAAMGPQDALESETSVPYVLLKVVARSWSRAVLALECAEPLEREAAMQMARHFLVVCDRAISSSLSSLARLLSCLQWVCFAASVLSCTRRADNVVACDAIQNQLDVFLLRLVHALSQTRAATDADALFSQHFIASWMALLPTESYAQVRNVLVSANDAP